MPATPISTPRPSGTSCRARRSGPPTITGLAADDIVAFARLYGSTRKSFIRAGFGFTRTRNGASAMHAVSCLPAMTGAWAEKGGGAFFLTYDKNYWGIDTTLLHGLDVLDPSIRMLDQSRIGAVLCGEADALRGGPPVEAMLMQNANSATVAPDTGKVPRGLGRDDLFLAVQEQFMTPTARYRRHPAAGHDVRGGRRHVFRARAHAPDLRPQAGGAARPGTPQQLCGRSAGAPARRVAPEFRDDADSELLDDGLRRGGCRR